jgi:hypothetical protein
MNSEDQGMHNCVICRFPADLDDVIVPTERGRCICLRCFTRETGTARPMDRRLREELTAVLEAADLAQSA